MSIFRKKKPSSAMSEKLCLRASNLQLQGEKCRNNNDLEGAIRFYQQALPLYRQAQQSLGEARILQGLGMICRDAKRFCEAEDYLNQALKHFRDLRDRYREGTTLDRMGTLYWQMGDNSRSIQNYLAATECLLDINQPEEALKSLGAAGYLQASDKQYNQAERNLERTISIARQIGDLDKEATASYHLGIALVEQGKNATAIQHFARVMAIYNETGIEKFASAAFNELKLLGAVEDAELSAPETTEWISSHPKIENSLAKWKQGQPQEAVRLLEAAAAGFEATADSKNAASAYDALGEICLNLGQVPEALEYSQKALDRCRELGLQESSNRLTLRVQQLKNQMEEFNF